MNNFAVDFQFFIVNHEVEAVLWIRNRIRIQEPCGSGYVFRIRIRIHTFKNRIEKDLRYELTI